MADKTGKNVTFKLDNAAGTLTAITTHLNSASLASVQQALEDTALGDGEQTFLPGVAGATFSLNGFWNSTTEGIFGPLQGNDTSKSKTFEWYDTIKYKNGEAIITGVDLSGDVDTVLTFSAEAQVTATINRTSVALA